MKYKTYEKVMFVEYQDLETLIEEVYGHRYLIPLGEEANNDTAYFYPLDKGEITGYDLEYLETFQETGEGEFIVSLLIQDLRLKGHLPNDNMILNICW